MLRKLYIRLIRNHVKDELSLQRIKLLYYFWSYAPILGMKFIPARIHLVLAFLRVDWRVLHAHRPAEITAICRAFNSVKPSGVMVEAGCWQGGSSTKFSHLCSRYGLKLHIYDSFRGVEIIDEGEHNFSGEYASSIDTLRSNLRKYGVADVCEIHPGWFAETLALDPPSDILIAYIDCDIAKGTLDALAGIMPQLATGGVVFSQDYQIGSVRNLLNDPLTWQKFGRSAPHISRMAGNLTRLKFST